MAIEQIKSPERIQRFIGLSTDTKPTAGVDDGYRFYESDSRKWYVYHNSAWNLDSENYAKYFKPSSYSANKSATITVSGQSEAIATGAATLRVRNLDATNYGLVAFGTSAATAESNASNGVAIEAGAMEYLSIPENATHYAWLGDTGTVTLNIIQGV